MPDTEIFSEPYGRVLLDEAVPCVIIQWFGFANRTEFLALQNTALRYLEDHATPARPWGLVADVRRMGAIPTEVQEWLVNDFNPRAVAAGLREVSVVPAETVFGQLATQRYQRESAATGLADVLPTVLYPTMAAAAEGARQAMAEASR
ncbi:hypothetical protein MON38_12095 [Hymenobacter sp. DH14]|uniref:Uncharacterized protein n=1 Tax=Hymenobacter cyanobacteriorum TaxID=2926463 RepID=A0A9X1VFW8_9BACT|nr:hypothetical protein [Hymenobacter cyanobacteriorum]MCI1188161.1 hypothetical protein [Hymenobacter cyanobacteriorum]